MPRLNQEAQDLKDIREHLGLSQGEFATKVNVSQAMISLMESGRVAVSDKMVAKLTQALTPEEVVG